MLSKYFTLNSRIGRFQFLFNQTYKNFPTLTPKTMRYVGVLINFLLYCSLKVHGLRYGTLGSARFASIAKKSTGLMRSKFKFINFGCSVKLFPPSNAVMKWSNYSSDGRKEGKIILALALAAVIKGNFLPSELKNAYVCPTGPSAESSVMQFKSLDPTYTCMSLQDVAWKSLVAPIVLPGNPDYDPEYETTFLFPHKLHYGNLSLN